MYSWYVYRFHQVAELVSFSALEMALRLRYLTENPSTSEQDKKRLGMLKLMLHAKDHGWMTNEGFSSSYARARMNARQKKMYVQMHVHDFEKVPSMPVEEPTKEEIEKALSEIDMVNAITTHSNKLRNDLAHGSSTLQPTSISTLSLNAEVINQLYTPPQ